MAAPARRLDRPHWEVRPRHWVQIVCLAAAYTALLFHRCWLYGESFVVTIDMYNQHYPITLGAVRTLLGGELPLWCPWRGAGTPWFAATSANLLDPFALWLYLFPNDVGINLQFMSYTFATMVVYYAFLRYWRVSHSAALIVAVLAVGSPNFLNEMPWRVLTAAHWLIPLALIALDVALRSARPLRAVLACGALLALGLFATQPQIWVYECLFVALYIGLWWWRRRGVRTAVRGLGLGAAVAVVFLSLAAVQALPFVELFGESNRAAPVEGAQRRQLADLGSQEAGLTRAEATRTVYADAQATVEAWAWTGRFYLTNGWYALRPYPGIEPGLTVLAIVGLAWGWRRTVVRFAGVIIALSAVGFNSFLRDAVTHIIPSFQLQRLNVFLPWVIGIAAAVGMDALRTSWHGRRGRAPEWIALACGTGILLAWIGPLRAVMPHLATLGVADKFALSYYLRVAVALGLLMLVLLRLRGFVSARVFRRALPVGAAASVIAHALFSGLAPVRHTPLDTRASLWPALMTPVRPERLAMLIMQPDPRYYGADLEQNLLQLPMHPNDAVLYDPPIPVVGDYNNLLVESYVEYMDMLNLGERSRGWFNMVGVANPGSPLVDLLGVRYLAGRVDARLAPGGARFRPVHQEDTFPYRHGENIELTLPLHVVENTRRLPRAFFLSRAVVVPDGEARRRMLADPAFDARRAVMLNTPPPAPIPVLVDMPATADRLLRPATITDYRTNTVRVDVDAPGAGLLVLTDVAFPGWTATVDDAPTAILTAYHTFRAVAVEAGSHTVHFTYWPRSFAIGAWVSGLAWCAAAVGWVVGGRRRRAGVS